MRIVILGLSITSSWGNGHATTFRGLVRELTAAGHDILFLERDQPWYAENRDLPNPPFGETQLYKSVAELKRRFAGDVRDADCVIVGILRAGWDYRRHVGDGTRAWHHRILRHRHARDA
jgi:spore maturation protein CgeB